MFGGSTCRTYLPGLLFPLRCQAKGCPLARLVSHPVAVAFFFGPSIGAVHRLLQCHDRGAWLKPCEGIVSSCVAGSVECLALLAPTWQQRAAQRVGEAWHAAVFT